MSDPTPDTTPSPRHQGGGGFLSRKFGALPLWAYALILAGMLAIGFWWKSRSRAASVATLGAMNEGPAQTGDGTSSADGYMSNGGTSSYGSTGGNIGTGALSGSASTTNAQWATNAANAINSAGGDPSAVQSALAAYLAGQTLSAAQQQIVNQAINLEGSPPQGVIPVQTSNPAVSYKVVSGDTITSIAQMFYGDSSKWKEIYQANITTLKGDPIGGLHHNQVLVLPGDGLLAQPTGTQSQALPANHVYTTQYGDNSTLISQKFYGSAGMASRIVALNGNVFKTNNGFPRPGTTIKLP